MALAKEGADLVLCGRKTLDSETWQVPPEVAAFLGWAHVTNAAALDAFGGRLQLSRETDFGFEIYEAEPPLVVSVGRAPETPVSDTEASDTGSIDVWQATDLVDDLREDDKRFGQPGSPTRVMAVRDSQPERNRERIEDVDQAATRILELLAERKPEPSPWEKPPHAAEIPGAQLRLLDDDRAGRQAAAASLARAPRSWTGPRREARRPERRARLRSDRTSRRSSGATAPRSSAWSTTRRSPSITRSSGARP